MPPKLELRELHEHAAARGGKFISDSYDGCRFHYLWECGTCKKQWAATWVNVKYHNSWCPNCRSSTREQVVRAAFQECFPGEAFDKNLTEIGMELDGYCATHRIAFEHDGVQHRKWVQHFQRTEEEFLAQLARDAKKDELCDQEQIWLFRIPDRELLKLKDIRAYVRKRLDSAFFIAPMVGDDNEFLQRAMIAGSKGGYLDESSEIVDKQGGTLLSTTCPIRTYPMRVSCEKGHNFETNYDNLVRGRWCPTCCATRKKTEDELAALVTSAGFTYHGSGSRKDSMGRARRFLAIGCPKHGMQEIMLDNFRSRKTCPACGKAKVADMGTARRLPDAEVRSQLALMGLQLLGRYQNNSTPSTFVCRHGHHFVSTLQKVRQSKGKCPGCEIGAFIPLQLVAAPTGPIDTMSTYQWKCSACSQVSDSTIRGIKIRVGKSGHICKNKKCPSRK